MAVTQTNTLKVIELVNNIIPVKLSTTNYITTVGVKSYRNLIFPTKDNGANKELLLVWDLESILFTTAVTPDESGNQIPQADGYATKELWVADVAIWLRKNETLFAAYHIWSSTNNIFFAAHEKNPDYDLRAETPPGTALNVTNGPQTAGVSEIKNENYTLILSVYVYNQEIDTYAPYLYDEFIKAKTYELEPLADSTADFYIESAIQPYFPNDVLPDWNQSGMVVTTDLLKKFYYRYSEKYGTPAIQKSTVESSVIYALNGGINILDFNTKSFYSDILLSGFSYKFLTWHPLTKKLTKEQHDYLYFIDITEPTFATLRYAAKLVDGTNENIDVTFTPTNQYDVHIIPVGYNYVNGLAFTKDVVSYNVDIARLSHGIPISEKRSFTIIEETPLLAKYYLFKNSLGAYQSIMFDGEQIKGIAVDKLSANKILNFDDDETINENVVAITQFNISNKVYTGFKTQADLDIFMEFLVSKSVLEQTDTYYKPVIVDAQKVTLYKKQEFIASAAVVIIDNTENNYSNA
jgi:hypothetical protein